MARLYQCRYLFDGSAIFKNGRLELNDPDFDQDESVALEQA
jgi:hypothetical protein